MACGSACCGSQDPPPAIHTSTQKLVNSDPESFCNTESKNTHNSANDFQDDCCDGQASGLSNKGSRCCSNTVTHDLTKVPSCCENEPTPSINPPVPGQEFCCSRLRRPSLSRHPVPCASVVSCCSTDSCCAPKADETGASAEKISHTEAYCSDAEPSTCPETCCAEKRGVSDSCCIGEKKITMQDIKEIEPSPARVGDLELGISGKEHVILSISGMTCTGCETKLSRTLATLPSITKLKTSLVLSRVEFDLDTDSQSVAEVIKHLERTTEFKCERVTNQGSSLDLICTSDPTEIVKSDWPRGVIDVRMLDKRTIRVDFDPKVIGARDLVKNGWPNSISLAAPSADPTLGTGARHVRHVGCMTLLSILLTIPVLILAWAPLPHKEQKKITYGSISLAFATIIQVAVAGPFYPKALKALIFSRVVEMDLLIVISTSAAYIFSVVAFVYLAKNKPLSTGEFSRPVRCSSHSS